MYNNCFPPKLRESFVSTALAVFFCFIFSTIATGQTPLGHALGNAEVKVDKDGTKTASEQFARRMNSGYNLESAISADQGLRFYEIVHNPALRRAFERRAIGRLTQRYQLALKNRHRALAMNYLVKISSSQKSSVFLRKSHRESGVNSGMANGLSSFSLARIKLTRPIAGSQSTEHRSLTMSHFGGQLELDKHLKSRQGNWPR